MGLALLEGLLLYTTLSFVYVSASTRWIAQSDGLRRSVICFMGNLQLHANAARIFLAQPSVRASCISVFPSPVSNERSFS